MDVQKIIDVVNGKRVELALGIHADIDQGVTLCPVIVRGHGSLSIYFPAWPSLTISFTPEAVKVWAILFAIAGDEPADLNGYSVDFHGQLPKVTPQPSRDCVLLTWRRDPIIDLRWVPRGLDPNIHSADLFAKRIDLHGSFGTKSIPIGGAA